MKRFIVFPALAMLAAVLWAPIAGAEVPNVGVVDMLRVSEGYKRYSETRKALEAQKAQLQSIVDDEERQVLALIEELEAVRATATQEEIQRRRQEIEGRDRELREFVITTNMQFRDELDTLQFRTKDEVETVVIAVAKTRGLTLVVERNMTLYAANSLDITNFVIEELNRRYQPLPAPSITTINRGAAATPSAPPTAFPAATPAGGQQRGWPFR